MNYNIYDDTEWRNDSNPYNSNRNTGCGENYDFSFDNDHGRGNLQADYMNLAYKLDSMEKILRDICNSNLCSCNHTNGYGGNYDFCLDNDHGRGSFPANGMNPPYGMNRMEKMLHDMNQKGKKHKKRKKKHHKGNQKFQKRLKAVEKQNDYIIGCLTVAMAQSQNTDKNAWLKQSIQNSAPNIVDLVSNVVTGKRQPLLPTQTLNQPLRLPDKSRGK